MTEKPSKILIGLLAIALAIYGGFWLNYYLSIQEENRKMVQRACEENRKEEFNGVVKHVNRYEYNDFMHGRYFTVQIETKDSTQKYIYYQYNLPENNELSDYVEVGQIARKQIGSDKFSLTDENRTIQFKIQPCDVIKE